jgi:hypothetical protein
MSKYREIAKDLAAFLRAFLSHPTECLRILRPLPGIVAGALNAKDWPSDVAGRLGETSRANLTLAATDNPLADYFESHQTGRGILKWLHYFDIYHRYFQKFVGREVHIVEIGIFSGGSLDMWKQYFGPKCRIYGVDIHKECKVYEDSQTKIFIGDQADRSFWEEFKKSVPRVDIVIDDGGHLPHQQIVTLEEMLPHLQTGGVFLCEDILGVHQGFAAYLYGLSDRLNAYGIKPDGSEVDPSEFQRSIYGVHLYPFLAVIEKAEVLAERFACPGHGTEWQPFSITASGITG